MQLPQKDPPPREVPEELERYEPPDVHALKHRLRKNDNSDLIPPWDPPDQEDEQIADLNAYSEFLSDPDFKDMGPYTDPGVADEYHSNDVQLRETHSEGSRFLLHLRKVGNSDTRMSVGLGLTVQPACLSCNIEPEGTLNETPSVP